MEGKNNAKQFDSNYYSPRDILLSIIKFIEFSHCFTVYKLKIYFDLTHSALRQTYVQFYLNRMYQKSISYILRVPYLKRK